MKKFGIRDWTGFLDENGKKIHEGDIIDMGMKNIGIVKWINAAFWFVLPYGEFRLHDKNGTIIGNIYENPELVQ